jgi:8-oxo-dGTP pyrophosphatase MutT (NUDIX family)
VTVDLPAGSALGADCVRALSAYEPRDGGQQQLRAEFLAHLTHRRDGWSRACAGAHLTASTLICSPTADRVLLVHHTKLRRWLQTGGHIEPTDPTLTAAALREAREESGFARLQLLPGIAHLDRHEVPCGPVQPCYHLDVRYLAVADPAQVAVGTETAHWFDVGALPTAERSVTVLAELARASLC